MSDGDGKNSPSTCSKEFKKEKQDVDLDLNALSAETCSSSGHRSTASTSARDFEAELTAKDEKISLLTKQLQKAERQLSKYQEYNESLRNDLSKLSSELHQYRTKSTTSAVVKDVGIQVSEAEIQSEFGDKPMPEWTNNETTSGLSIADSLKAAAESVLSQQHDGYRKQDQSIDETQKDDGSNDLGSDYVYDAASGLYYHPSTGYYWDPNYGLFYDYTTGTYYHFDETTGEYKVHSQVQPSQGSLMGEMNGSNGPQAAQRQQPSSTDNHELKRKEERRRRKIKLEKRDLVKKSGRRYTDKDREGNTVSINDSMEEDMDTSESLLKASSTDRENRDNNLHYEKSKLDDEKNQKDINYEDEDSDSSCSLATGESELESGEVTSSSSSDVEVIGYENGPKLYCEGEALAPSTAPDPETDDVSSNYPPCIRAIVTVSSCLDIGTLFIITCMGGTVGRMKKKGLIVEIPEELVSKEHSRIRYDHEENCYKISDLGSQNGTWVNGHRLKKSSGEHPLSHGDRLQICSTCLLCHIHRGNETCDDCEPGQVRAKFKATQKVSNDHVVLSKAEKEKNRRDELKKIKKKYGLQRAHFENANSSLNKDQYSDAAYLRKKYIGSDVEGAKTERPASVHQPVSAENKGHKLLAKMGWKEGQGLGKNNNGIAEPITVSLRANANAGLGSAHGVALSLDDVNQARKAKRWTQAQQRFQKLKSSDGSSACQAPNEASQISDTTPLHNESNVYVPSISSPLVASPVASTTLKLASKGKILWHRGEVQYSDNTGSNVSSEVSNSETSNKDLSNAASSDLKS